MEDVGSIYLLLKCESVEADDGGSSSLCLFWGSYCTKAWGKVGGLVPAVLGFSVMDWPGSRNLTGAITPPSPCRGAEDCCAARQSSEYEYQYLTSTTDNCKT